MNPALKQLKDIHLPQAIGTWPIAAGWIGLCILIFIVLCVIIVKVYRIMKKRRPMRYAFKRLQQLRQEAKDSRNQVDVAEALSSLVRRCALYSFDRDMVAGLAGERWLQFLNESGNTQAFTSEAGKLLVDVPYRKQHTENLDRLFTIVYDWLSVIASKREKERSKYV